MKLFFDRRLGYLVAAPGQDTALATLQAKSGDTEEIIIQFGRSSDPTSTTSIITAPTWTAENLAGGTVITAAIKADGDYSDGTVLATNSTWTNDAGAFTYTGTIGLNTTAINTALERLDANAADDIASLDCGFEVTYQIGGSGGWKSSVLPITWTLYHDIIGGAEGTPTDAADPDEYLLKASGIEWLPTISSLTGGTSVDLDYVPTVGVTVGKVVAFLDTDPATDLVRFYKLTAGTTAESSPTVIRPDDYATTTNEKVWVVQIVATGGLIDLVDDVTPQLGATLDANSFNIGFDDNTGILDDAGNEQLIFQKTASAVNQLEITNAATGTSPSIGAAGGDANIDINFITKGSGVVKSNGTALIVNPMTTTGDIIKGGASGAPGRLAIGSTGNVLTVSGGAPVWAAPSTSGGAPSAVVTYTVDTAAGLSDIGKLILLDTSANVVTLDIPVQATVAWTDNAYFWVCKTNATYSGYLDADSGTIVHNGTSGATLTLGAQVHLVYRQAADDWRIISVS